jgi:hypothetical protein
MPDDVRLLAAPIARPPRQRLHLSLGPTPPLTSIELRCASLVLNADGKVDIEFDWGEDGDPNCFEMELEADEARGFRIGETYRFDIIPAWAAAE